MKLLELNINKCLLLENFKFKDSYNNIDWLNAEAIFRNNLEEKLNLLTMAANQLEKFHSFFHFEQSFFHLQLAIKYLQLGKKEEADVQLEAAIFQDHVNKQAINLKQNIQNNDTYKRPYDSFLEYLKFASGEDFICNYVPENYWAFNQDDVFGLKDTIQEIRKLHLAYHQESAKLYLNRAIIFKALVDSAPCGNDIDQKCYNKELAKNDLTKAHNLDSALRERPYYEECISQIGAKVALGLGSNLGNRESYLEQAIEKLQDLKILYNVEYTSSEETKALLLPGSPKEWDLNYLNMVVVGVTILTPEDLLRAIKNIEHILGRDNSRTWAPREIDIDILLYEEEIVKLESLTIPHSQILYRPWVLKALAEICPNWYHPEQQKKIKDLI